ncbi:MAG: KpsF/GutQ family sugar-phosphate isomerase [Acidobacteria bacterium]|nr:KpsF/GutQ family sugar-phosphate isomerase [Acidobacteriota bacterium]
MLKSAREVLEIEAQAIRDVANRLGPSFIRAVDLLFGCRGRVIITGMGKSGIIGTKLAATFSSTGTPSLFLHPAEAIHGDIGTVTVTDIVLAISNSGETEEILKLLDYLQRLNIPLISMVGQTESTLARDSQVVLDISVREEACPLGLAPTASTTAALALGDALAMVISKKRGFTTEDFVVRHPGGQIGKSMLRVENLMQTGKAVPSIPRNTPMQEAIVEMSAKGFGMTNVVDEKGDLVGILTDGDLRRLLSKGRNLLDRPIHECMSKDPITIDRKELATRALHLLESKKITSLAVVEGGNHLVGLIHLHHLWRTGMI